MNDELTESNLIARERYLTAVVSVQQKLLVSQDPQKVYQEALAILGDVSGASRVYIFENSRDANGRLLMNYNAEWCAEKIEPEIDNSYLQNLAYEDSTPRWADVLSTGEVINSLVKDLPENERTIIESFGVLSVLALPIIVRHEFFGFIGFDNCTEEQIWDGTQVKLLQAAAQAFSLAHERKRAELSLQESEVRFREIFDNANDLVYTTDLKGKFINVNKTCLRITGYTLEELPDITVMDVVAPEYREFTQKMIEAKLKGEKSETVYESMLLTKDGKCIPIEINARVILRDGKPVAIQGIARDITERKRAEHEIQATQEKFAKAFSSSPMPIIITKLSDGTILDINETGLRLHGFTREELVGNTTTELMLWAKPRSRDEVVEQLKEKGSLHEFEAVFRSKDDKKRTALVSAELLTLDNEECCLWVASDITERKEAERALRTSEERYRAFIENSSEGIWCFEVEPPCPISLSIEEQIDWWYRHGFLVECNDVMARMYGYEHPEEIVGARLTDLLPPDDPYNLEYAKNFILSGYKLSDAETHELDKDGNPKYFRNNLAGVIEDEKLVRAWGTQTDITQRREAEEALRTSEERLRAFVENSTEGIWRFEFDPPCPINLPVDEQVEWLYRTASLEECNDAMAKMYGHEKASDILGKKLSDTMPPSNPANIEALKHFILSGYRVSGEESEEIDKDGNPKYFLNNVVGTVIDGELLRFWGTQSDITERRKIEEALRFSNEALETLIESAPIGILVTSFDFTVEVWNSAAEKILGWTKEEVSGYRMPEVIPEDYLEQGRQWRRTLSKGGIIENQETVRVRKDGTFVEITVSASPLHEAHGQINSMLYVFSDNTERKIAEAALRESEERYGVVVETATDAIITIDEVGKILFANHSTERIFGYKVEEITRQPISMLMPKRLRGAHHTGFNRYIQTGKRNISWEGIEIVGCHKDGHEIPLEISFAEIVKDGKKFFTGILRDITERKLAEETMRKSERRFRVISEAVSDFVFDVKVTRKNNLILEMVSDAFLRATGYSYEAIKEMQWQDLVYPDDLSTVKKFVAKVLGNKKEVSEHRIVTHTGKVIWTRIYAQPVWDETEKRVVRFYGAAQDITERKEAEKALQESELRFRKMSEAISDYAYDMRVEEDGSMELESVSDAFGRMIGYSIEEMKERGGWLSIVHPDDLGFVRTTGARLATGKQGHGEFRIVNKQGETRWVLNYPNPIWDEEKGRVTRIYGSCQDITERKLAEEALAESEGRLRQSQKMEAIGRLAGGIAHDFNNILTSIIGYSDITLRYVEFNDPLRRNIEEIRKSADRAAKLTNQLLAYSRKQILQPTLLDLNEIVYDIDRMLHRLIGEDIVLENVLAEKVAKIKADKGQIEQVLMNLVVNARDAMTRGGRLLIKTTNMEVHKPLHFKGFTITPNRYVLLQVSDTGQGMSDEVKEKIFEPFFTTKEVGKGTGLGLATVHGIINQSGGYVTFESEVGKGTTFNIYLPFAEGEEKEVEGKMLGKKQLRGVETILLVDDDEVVRKLTREVLEIYGYKILTTVDCNEAIDVCRNYPETIHLLITDVIMPKMSGRELVEQLIEIRPEMKVLYMSGYSDNELGIDGRLENNVQFLQKPFSIETMTALVREILDSRN